MTFHLQILNGVVSYVFDLGDGRNAVSIQGSPLYDGQWHSVTVQRAGRFASINLDGELVSNTTSSGRSEWLDISPENIYLAGLPQSVAFDGTTGYSGCVRDVRLDFEDVPLSGSNSFFASRPSESGTSSDCQVGRCSRACSSSQPCNLMTGQCECPSGICISPVVADTDSALWTRWYMLYAAYPLLGILLLITILLLVRHAHHRRRRSTLKNKLVVPPVSPFKHANNRSLVLPNQEPDSVVAYSLEGGMEGHSIPYNVDLLVQEISRSASAASNHSDGSYGQQETAMTSLCTTPGPPTRPGSANTYVNTPRQANLANPLDRVMFLERGGISGRSSVMSSHRSSRRSTPGGSNVITPRSSNSAQSRNESPIPSKRASPQGASRKATPHTSPRPGRRVTPPGEADYDLEYTEVQEDFATRQELHQRLYKLDGDGSLATADEKQVFCDEGECNLSLQCGDLDDAHLQHYAKEPVRLGDPRRLGPRFQPVAKVFVYTGDSTRRNSNTASNDDMV